MRVIKTYIVILIFLFTGIFPGSGQNNISLRTNIDSTVIGFDIPIAITIKANTTVDSFQIQALSYKEALQIYSPKTNTSGNNQQGGINDEEIEKTDFEISDFGDWKGNGKTIKPGNSKSNIVKIKIWDTGQFVILPVSIIYNNNKIDTIYPDDPDRYPQISVFAGINPKDTLKSIAPIKDIIREKKNWKDYMWIYITVLALIIIILALVFLPKLFINKKTDKEPEKVIEKIIPAHIIAIEKLNKLKAEKIWKQGKIKEFQSQLTFILREYLENRYKIQALEQTTGEIVHSLEKTHLDNKDIDTIKNILQIADMVKFAKAKPDEDIHEKFLNETIDFVERTKVVPIQNNTKG